MIEAQIAEALRKRAARLRAGDEAPGGSEWGYVPNVLVRLADEIEAGLDEQVATLEDLRSRLRDARWLDGEEAVSATEQVAHEAVAALERTSAIRCNLSPALFRRIEALGFEAGSANPVRWLVGRVESLVAERDKLAAEVERSEDVASERRSALANSDAMFTAIRLALDEEGGVQGWRPPRGVDPVLDLALDVREERDRLRGAR